MREAIEATGAALRYLPAHSPDVNPIEQVFAKLEHLLRRAETRTKDALRDTIGGLLDAFSLSECARCIRHAGYGQSA